MKRNKSPLGSIAQKFDIVLGSKSPRRKDLLTQLGLPFSVRTGDIDESLPAEIKAKDAAEWLAVKKGMAMEAEIGAREILLTADTVVILDNQVLAKPENKAEAVDMIRKLSGKSHFVDTGVSLMTHKKSHSFSVRTKVYFHDLTEDEIAHYVGTFKPLDKAGAYGIQEWIGLIGVRRIEGCFYNVIGLPVPRLYQELKKFQTS